MIKYKDEGIINWKFYGSNIGRVVFILGMPNYESFIQEALDMG